MVLAHTAVVYTRYNSNPTAVLRCTGNIALSAHKHNHEIPDLPVQQWYSYFLFSTGINYFEVFGLPESRKKIIKVNPTQQPKTTK